MKFCHKT